MPKKIYVIGHKNPDTDSICAAIAYAKLKNTLGDPHVIACRAGNLNTETRYVLDRFGIDEPELLADTHIRVRDLLNGPVTTVQAHVPLLEAWMLMRSEKIKTLPVVDAHGQLTGLVTVGDVAEKYMDELAQRDLSDLHVKVENVVKTLSGTLLNGCTGDELKGNLVIGAMHWDSMKKVLPPGCVVIMGDREKGQKAALEAGASCLILTNGARLTPDMEKEVQDKGTTVISVPMDTFSAARMIMMSAPVRSIMRTGDLTTFEDNDLLEDAKRVMLETRFRNYPVVDEDNHVIGSIARYHILGYTKKQVILVDHNEFSQAVNGIEEAQILEVVDHHRVGGIQTGEPILFRNEPVGSTCTLVAKAYFENGLTPEPEIAGIMCAAILSDTVIFKSPTCTSQDREMARKLAEIAGINPEEFGIAMFKQSSSLSQVSPADILNTDLKEFMMGDTRFGIGQVSTMGFEELPQIMPGLFAEMESQRSKDNLGYMLLMVTDLLSESTVLLISGPRPEIIGEAFGTLVADNQTHLPGVLSRKKQIIPPLTKFFTK